MREDIARHLANRPLRYAAESSVRERAAKLFAGAKLSKRADVVAAYQKALTLKGTVALTSDARNVVTFDGLPDIPISQFTLTFAGGPNGITFATKDLCATPKPPLVFDADFASFSGASAHVSPTATVDCSGASGGGGGGGGGGHQNQKPPKAKLNLDKLTSKHPTLKLAVRKGSEPLRSAVLALPMITVNRLLKSCATPPASSATLSFFCACRNRSSAARRAVASVKIAATCPGRGEYAIAS